LVAGTLAIITVWLRRNSSFPSFPQLSIARLLNSLPHADFSALRFTPVHRDATASWRAHIASLNPAIALTRIVLPPAGDYFSTATKTGVV
jgi:hypothetical protein